jgi:hypothetical protein
VQCSEIWKTEMVDKQMWRMGTMRGQQVTGLALSLVGLAAFILSVGVAWFLSRVSRTRRVESAGMISAISIVLFLAGVVACYFGVSALVEG